MQSACRRYGDLPLSGGARETTAPLPRICQPLVTERLRGGVFSRFRSPRQGGPAKPDYWYPPDCRLWSFPASSVTVLGPTRSASKVSRPCQR